MIAMSGKPLKRHPKAARIIWLVFGAIVFAVLFVAGLGLYIYDSGADTGEFHQGTLPADHLTLNVRVDSIDPAKEEADVTIAPVPTGGLTDDQGWTAKKDLTFQIITDDAVKNVTIKAGDPMISSTVTIPLDGDISVYPFDSYGGNVAFSSDLPLGVNSESHIQAYHAAAAMGDHPDPNSFYITYDFSRSLSIVLFALFVYLLIALVATVAITVTILVTWHGYGLEFGHIGWVAALLFVLPAVRSGMPGGPPVGTMIDFIVFFWAEVLVVACLVVLVFGWIRAAKPDPEHPIDLELVTPPEIVMGGH
jgi:hypothetical protein